MRHPSAADERRQQQRQIGRGRTRTNADNFNGNGETWPRMTRMNADCPVWRTNRVAEGADEVGG